MILQELLNLLEDQAPVQPKKKFEWDTRLHSACELNKVPIATVWKIWNDAYKYKSWKLEDFMATPPSRETVRKARKAVELFLEPDVVV